MEVSPIFQQIAYGLQKQNVQVAFVMHQGKVYYSYHTGAAITASSAVVNLMQGLFHRFVDNSFFILRNRIYTTATASEMCLGMVKVVAKRITDQVVSQNHSVPLDLEFVEIKSFAREDLCHQDMPSLPIGKTTIEQAWCLAEENLRGEILHDYHRKIAALLVDENGQLLAWGLNSNSKNKTLHAEVNLVQSYVLKTGNKIPLGAKLYSTHKPCRMCAGMIYEFSNERKKPFVFYDIEEIGSLSKNTILDRLYLNQKIT